MDFSNENWSVKIISAGDLAHVLTAIVEGLDDHLKWPDGNKRTEISSVFIGFFLGGIGIGDVKVCQTKNHKILWRKKCLGVVKKYTNKMLSTTQIFMSEIGGWEQLSMSWHLVPLLGNNKKASPFWKGYVLNNTRCW